MANRIGAKLKRPRWAPTGSPNGRIDGASRLEDLVVITGFSGAGKSTAMNVFEDAGYFCVDNLPPEMIRSLVELFVHEGSKVERAAVVSDVRGGEYFDALRAVLEELPGMGVRYRVLFLDADELTLLNRYKETRRRHPVSPTGSIATGIASERAMLDPLKGWPTPSSTRAGSRPARCAGGSPTSSCPIRRRRVSPSRSRASASSTARRATPTSCSTSGSFPTRTGSRPCAS